MYDDAPFDKAKTFQMLRERGIIRAIVAYSGGNDEGGVEKITLFKSSADEPVTQDLAPFTGAGYSYVDGQWKQIEPPTDEDSILAQQLGAPVYERYGSFAGEFYVDGEIVFEVASETVTVQEDYETPSSTHREQVL